MVRRWSCIININNNFTNFYSLKKNFKINVFKSSVNFKKFTSSFTKFKRKSLIRIKHKSNFLIYTNIIKFWVKDFLFQKNYLKFQFFNKIFINNFFFLNINFIKIKNNDIFNNYNFFFSNFTNKNNNFFFHQKSFNFFKYTPISIAYSDLNNISNDSILPIYSSHDSLLYPLKNLSISLFESNILFDLFFSILMKKTLEIRKILIFLFLKNF